MIRSPAVVISIPSPKDRHDGVLSAVVAPVVRALRASPSLHAAWFLRVNKPDWGLRVLVTGEPGWLERDARATLMPLVTEAGATFVEDELDDKWTGRLDVREALEPFHHHDTWGCLQALEAEGRGRLGSRAQFSMVVVERLLDVGSPGTELEFAL